MVRFAVLAAMLCGCAQLFGIDETTRGAPPSASLSFQRVSIGARVVYAPQDLAGSMGTYLVPDEAAPGGLSRVPAAQAELGRWSAPITGAAPILFDLPDYPKPLQRIFDFPQAQVKGLFGVLEHPSPQPAPAGATITVNVTLDAAYTGIERFELFTVGSWNTIPLPAPPLNTVGLSVPPFAFTSMTSITGRPHERITSEDGVVVLRYDNLNILRGALKAAPFDQTGTDAITGTMTAVAVQPFTFAIDQADVMRRYSMVRPPVGNLTMSWAVRAAPGAQLNNENGPLLAAGGPTDLTSVKSQAGNPFAPDWPSTAVWATQATRMYTPPSPGLPVTLVANMSERALLADGLQMKLPAVIPAGITLSGTVLESDGLSIAKPTRAAEVTFTADPATTTMYQLQLFKLVPNMAGTALQLELKVAASGAAPRFLLPPELFEAGSLYTLRAIAVAGCFPGLGAGDLTQRTIPCAVSFVDSGVFTVAP